MMCMPSITRLAGCTRVFALACCHNLPVTLCYFCSSMFLCCSSWSEFLTDSEPFLGESVRSIMTRYDTAGLELVSESTEYYCLLYLLRQEQAANNSQVYRPVRHVQQPRITEWQLQDMSLSASVPDQCGMHHILQTCA